LLAAFDVEVAWAGNNRVAAGAMKQRVVTAEGREHLGERLLVRLRARKDGFRRDEQADFGRCPLGVTTKKWCSG
jgi:hypothetical protein